MEILDKLQEKVRNAVQKIEELQARVDELEEIKRQYEEKIASLVSEFGDDDTSTDSSVSESSSSSEEQESQPQEGLYRHQFQ